MIEVPNDLYKKFFLKFQEIETSKVEEWKIPQLIGYFVKKYYEAYGTDFKFKFNSTSPSKCFEVFQMKKLSIQLSSDPNILKEYIDWVFQNKVSQAKRKLTSISFLTNEKYLYEYKSFMLNPNKTIDRSTSIPDKWKDLFLETKCQVSTYGDLAFLYQSCDPTNEKLINIFSCIGFDKEILNKIL